MAKKATKEETIDLLKRQIKHLNEDLQRVEWACSSSVIRGEIVKLDLQIEKWENGEFGTEDGLLENISRN